MAAPHSSAAAAVAKQVTQSNFAAAVRELRAHLDACDFVSVAAQKTGAPVGWRRVLPVDTAETAYLKAKLAAESFEPLHLAVCPFRFLPSASNILAFPYNFHLFPRDELNLGMPSYSFSCQSSYLSSMAQDGFDFNMCIYDGISYLSRVQESLARQKILISPRICQLSPSPATTVADSVFMGRVKSRIEHWRKGCVEPSKTADGSLVSSLRKLILGDESYASRPSMSISICSDRQVQLVLEAVNRIGDDLLPLVVPDKAGAARAVRVIFTSSKEDKNLLMMEIKKLEDEQNLRFRGFREVIDLLSASQKPIISYNCLNDFTMIHSKFVAPLPPNLHEFMCSLRMVFSNFIDVGHLWREIGPLRKAQNISAALSYLQRQFFVPIEMEIPLQDDTCSVTKSGKNILRITKLFAKLSNLLKISPDCRSQPDEQCRTIEDYSNVLYPSYIAQESDDVDCTYESDATKKISTENIVFLWGFSETSDKELRCRLRSSHEVFSKHFELKLLDKACSALIFHSSDSARELLREISVESPALTNFFSEGMKAAGFDAYRKVCKLGLWDLHLADALDSVSSEPSISPTHSGHGTSEMCWNGDMMLDLKEYLES